MPLGESVFLLEINRHGESKHASALLACFISVRGKCCVVTLTAMANAAAAALATSCLFNPVLQAELMRHSYLNNLLRLKLQIFAPQQLCVVTEINILTGPAIPSLPRVSG